MQRSRSWIPAAAVACVAAAVVVLLVAGMVLGANSAPREHSSSHSGPVADAPSLSRGTASQATPAPQSVVPLVFPRLFGGQVMPYAPANAGTHDISCPGTNPCGP
jgi:hypothetical protein